MVFLLDCLCLQNNSRLILIFEENFTGALNGKSGQGKKKLRKMRKPDT